MEKKRLAGGGIKRHSDQWITAQDQSGPWEKEREEGPKATVSSHNMSIFPPFWSEEYF